MPRSPPEPNSGPVAATSTTLSFAGSMTMRLMCLESRSPMFVNVLPPSLDFHTPSPHEVLWRLFDSPVPTHTTSGFDCDTATSPIDISPRSSKMGVSTAPLLVVFQTPPCAAPTYQIDVFFSYTAMSAIRPDMMAGPIERKWSLSNCVATGVCAGSDDAKQTTAAASARRRDWSGRCIDSPRRGGGSRMEILAPAGECREHPAAVGLVKRGGGLAASHSLMT